MANNNSTEEDMRMGSKKTATADGGKYKVVISIYGRGTLVEVAEVSIDEIEAKGRENWIEDYDEEDDEYETRWIDYDKIYRLLAHHVSESKIMVTCNGEVLLDTDVAELVEDGTLKCDNTIYNFDYYKKQPGCAIVLTYDDFKGRAFESTELVLTAPFDINRLSICTDEVYVYDAEEESEFERQIIAAVYYDGIKLENADWGVGHNGGDVLIDSFNMDEDDMDEEQLEAREMLMANLAKRNRLL